MRTRMVLAGALLGAAVVGGGPLPAAAAGPVTVSITFDDTWAEPLSVLPLLDRYGYRATSYVNSDRIGGRTAQGAFLTLPQLRQLSAAGHEIGSHSIGHVDVTTLSRAAKERAMCGDRRALQRLGLVVRTFAYPFGKHDAAARSTAASCGFTAARASYGLRATGPYAETVPPSNRYALRAVNSVRSTDTLASLVGHVDRAAARGGGWIPYTFHRICPDDRPGCSSLGITHGLFDQFTRALARRGVRVRPVTDALSPPPVVPVTNGSLDADVDRNRVPDCWKQVGLGGVRGTGVRVSGARGGSYGWRMTIAAPSPASSSLRLVQEPRCAMAVTTGQRYRVTVWYKGGPGVRLVLYSPDSEGVWLPWSQSAARPAVAAWTSLTYVSPTARRATLRMAAAMHGVGQVTIDSFSAVRHHY